MSAQHTASPWRVMYSFSSRDPLSITSPNGIVATVVAGYAADIPESQANARLIAAAPAMYEALRKTKTCALPTEVRDLVNAALAAAEGRSTKEPA